MVTRAIGLPVLTAVTSPYIDVMFGPNNRRRLFIIRTPTSREAAPVDIGDASDYVNIVTSGEALPGTAVPRIAPLTALGDLGQPTWNPSGPLPPCLTLLWSDHDTQRQIFFSRTGGCHRSSAA